MYLGIALLTIFSLAISNLPKNSLHSKMNLIASKRKSFHMKAGRSNSDAWRRKRRSNNDACRGKRRRFRPRGLRIRTSNYSRSLGTGTPEVYKNDHKSLVMILIK